MEIGNSKMQMKNFYLEMVSQKRPDLLLVIKDVQDPRRKEIQEPYLSIKIALLMNVVIKLFSVIKKECQLTLA
jgi:hypothetical protein